MHSYLKRMKTFSVKCDINLCSLCFRNNRLNHASIHQRHSYVSPVPPIQNYQKPPSNPNSSRTLDHLNYRIAYRDENQGDENSEQTALSRSPGAASRLIFELVVGEKGRKSSSRVTARVRSIETKGRASPSMPGTFHRVCAEDRRFRGRGYLFAQPRRGSIAHPIAARLGGPVSVRRRCRCVHDWPVAVTEY